MNSFNTVGLVARVANEQIRDSLMTVEGFLLERGRQVVVEEFAASVLGPGEHRVADLRGVGESCDLVIAVGGDGNILSSARAMAPFGVPNPGHQQG